MKRIFIKFSAAVLGTAMIFTGSPFSAFASSPSFARTDEEWASLRDNRMEYGELEGLVQEYNPAVQQNQFDYQQFRKDYGDKKDDVTQHYRDLAQEILSDITYPDPDDANYAALMTVALSSETQAKNLETTADKNMEDSETKRLTYEMAEKTLVQTAENNMISYHTGLLDITKSEKERDLSSVLLAAAQARRDAGTGTDTEVLTSQQSELSAEQAVLKSQSDLSDIRRKLQIMLGWDGNAEPEIGDIPEPDLSRIDGMDPVKDRDKALENNYTLRINQKKLANANSDTQKNTLNSTIADNKAKIAWSLTTAWQNVITARNNYNALLTDTELKRVRLEQASLKYGNGTDSRLSLDQAQIAYDEVQISLEEAKLTLFQNMETYDWNVKGLANAS
jgi:outer membrane protein TolC